MLSALKSLGREGRALRTGAAASLLAAACVAATAVPAQAANVSGCTGWSLSGYAACVRADMGGKWVSHNVQWVGDVTAYRTDAGDTIRLEIWGDGFYKSYYPPYYVDSHSWSIDKWVGDNTYICARVTSSNGTDTACIHVSV